jgi:hypothetical protein
MCVYRREGTLGTAKLFTDNQAPVREAIALWERESGVLPRSSANAARRSPPVQALDQREPTVAEEQDEIDQPVGIADAHNHRAATPVYPRQRSQPAYVRKGRRKYYASRVPATSTSQARSSPRLRLRNISERPRGISVPWIAPRKASTAWLSRRSAAQTVVL